MANTKGQRTMKTAIEYFWPFSHFRIEGRKQQNFDFQSIFSTSKIDPILLNFFFIDEYKKWTANFGIVIF